jgi:signal recognition particle GTPase
VFDRLRKGLSSAVSKIVVTELKAEKLRPILDEFRLNLIENDVAVPVAYFITDELERRLDGVQVKRLGDRKDLVKDTLHEVLIEILTTKETVNLLAIHDSFCGNQRNRENYKHCQGDTFSDE